MKKICIVEIKSGNHSVAELCKYANPDKNEVLLFTTSSLLTNIKNDLGSYSESVKIHVKDDNQSFYSFVQKINKACLNGVDLLVLNTVSRWELMFLDLRCPIYAYFYSLKFWFQDLNSAGVFFRNIFQLNYLNLVSWLPTRWHANPYFGTIIRKMILKKVDGIIVEYPPFVDVLRSNYKVNRPIYFLPKRTYNPSSRKRPKQKIVFVIPGMISELRRDYDLVIDAFENIPYKVKSNIKLIVLGKPIKKFGVRIVERLRKLDESEIEVKYFTEFISHDRFSNCLRESDLIIAPIKLDYRSGVIHEKFTYTKGTGTFPDMIRYAKPTIVPEEYNIADELRDCFIRYESISDLRSLIVEFSLDTEKLRYHQRKTEEIMKKYSLINMQRMFGKLLDDIDRK